MAHGQPVLVKEKYPCWGKGRRGLLAPVTIAVYETVVRAEGEFTRLTEAMMLKILKKEFPKHFFRFTFRGEYLKAIADRWTDDGIKEQSSDIPEWITQAAKDIDIEMASLLQQEYKAHQGTWWLFTLGEPARALTAKEIAWHQERGDIPNED